MNSNKQGNGIFVVLIIVSAIAFGVYSVSNLINGESRINQRAEAYQEARQAVESLIQSGVADLHARFENSGAIPSTELSPANNPLSLNNDFLAIYGNTNNRSNLVIPDVTRYTSIGDLFSQDTEIIGSIITTSERTVIDRTETGNEGDPQAGVSLFKRTVEIFGKATVRHPSFDNNDITVYARQFLEIREIPLFSYAIFYNLPMEIAPGPDMDVYRNVHVNGDAWFQSGSGNSLNFRGRVTIAGDVHHGRHPDSGKSDSPGAVNFWDSSDTLINMKENVSWPETARDAFSGTWLESGGENAADNFSQLADQIWDGNLQTKDHNVESVELPGISPYIEDVDESTPEKEAFNSAYTIIEPILDKIDIPSASSDPEGYERARAQRAAEKNKFSSLAGLTIEVSNDGALSYYSYQRDSYKNIVYGSDGSPIKVIHTPTAEIAKNKTFRTSNGVIVDGLYDIRQDQNMNLVELDISILKDLVHNDNGNDWGGGNANKPEAWWTGVVYVKFPQTNASSDRPDNVNPANARNWGVKLVNGDVIPNPAFAQSDNIYGTSIATNQVMYVEGHYNSDGDVVNTGSPTDPDSSSTFNQEGQEAPAALAADAITFLSENWNDADSNKSLQNRVAQPTEVSAAILTGLVPSGKSGSDSYSGGVENFPRFLENWQGKDFVMRGSIVAMFESEIATEGWGKADVYKAPRRRWGYHNNYNETPPQGPRLTAYRGRDLQMLNACDYHERVELNWGIPVPAGICSE